MLPARKERPEPPAKQSKREKRWRSPAHTLWLTKEFRCAVCGSSTNVVAAHVRLGSHTGMSCKPDDWRCVPLCDGPFSNASGGTGCHQVQHNKGEATFWKGRDVEAMIVSLIHASPKRREIEQVMRERRLA